MNQTFLILTILGMVFFGSIYGGLKGKIGNGVLVFKALATLMPVLAAFAGVRANNSMSGWLMVGGAVLCMVADVLLELVLLAGVAVGMLLGAITSGILTFMNEQKLQQYLFWMVGGLDYRRWEHVYLAVGPVLVGIFIMLLLARHLNILVLGETEAKAVGMPVMQFRMGLLFVAAITTATSVCVSGNIGFVGLVIPHMMRMLLGPDHRVLLPASALGGALFLVICDCLGRVVVAPAEVRVGIMTAILGSPYFLYLLRKMQKSVF